MKSKRNHVIAMLLVGALTAVAVVPAAHADGYRGRGDGYRGNQYFQPQGIDRSSGRSYFYRDCQSGAVDTYISNLRPGYGRDARPSRVEKVDICTGAVLATYVWDHDQWCSVDRGGSVSRGDWRGRDGRGQRGDQRYAWGGWNGR